jgi:hypothetical protein
VNGASITACEGRDEKREGWRAPMVVRGAGSEIRSAETWILARKRAKVAAT